MRAEYWNPEETAYSPNYRLGESFQTWFHRAQLSPVNITCSSLMATASRGRAKIYFNYFLLLLCTFLHVISESTFNMTAMMQYGQKSPVQSCFNSVLLVLVWCLLTMRGNLKLSLSKEHSFTASASPWRTGTNIWKLQKTFSRCFPAWHKDCEEGYFIG